MSSLFKRSKWTLQYHDDDRVPKTKQFSLRTTSKRTAKRLQAELDDLYQRGLFDPWVDDFRERLDELKRPDKPSAALLLQDAVDAFLFSMQSLARSTVRMSDLVTRLLLDQVGNLPVHRLRSRDIRSVLDGGGPHDDLYAHLSAAPQSLRPLLQ